ncbi:hypothetical protein U14_02574 [Candidatus Moduliflexus flocculans]|uniref:Uncharacterized protein n=1 Tax=Candidatus Moduliflexus flocculans TaxID=1499966 RepID=A0A081BLR5_9BACT|nr:hypothetical protein U14_02574 [Candidatus Moduliflexus flocculans]
MAQLGILGSILAQAAKNSESTVAALITSQQETIEKEVTPQKPDLQKIPGKGDGRKHSKRPRKPSRRPPQETPSNESPTTPTEA